RRARVVLGAAANDRRRSAQRARLWRDAARGRQALLDGGRSQARVARAARVDRDDALARAQPGRSLARRASDRNLRRALALRPAPGALTNQQPRRSARSLKSLARTSQARHSDKSLASTGPYSVGREPQ